jgi:nitrogen-specific signal transduction histidine kinase
MNEALQEVIELTRGEALKNGVSVKTQFAHGLPIIAGDRVQLQQVVLNLILNDETKARFLAKTEGAPLCSAEMHCGVDDSVEYGLQVVW